MVPVAGLLLYLSVTTPLARYMAKRPSAVGIGTVPQSQVLRYVALDHRPLVGAYYTLKALNYFGGKSLENATAGMDYLGIYQAIEAALQLDPYNIDAYYFSQAILVWDLREIKLANSILQYGMKHRTWDAFLPFSAGFNYSYFLHDYERAAYYYQRGAELSGSPLMTSLASRYLYESGNTTLAIRYLEILIPKLTNQALRQRSLQRLEALRSIDLLEKALRQYAILHGEGSCPENLEFLVEEGLLPGIPTDPYGGRFFLDNQGRVRTKSNLALPK